MTPQAKRMIALAAAFNDPTGRKLIELVGPIKAAEIRSKRREVADKVHRSPPPSIDGMRF